MAFDIQGARNAGYSDAEIVQYLAGQKDSGGFDFGGALKAGYSPSEILKHVGEPSTSYTDALRQGGANLVGGVGETVKQYVSDNAGDALKNAAKVIAPENYAPAQVVSKENGFTPSALPRAAVESAPGMAASIAAARLTPGPAWLKLLAGSGAYALQSLGNKAKERAANNGNETPTTSDKLAAAVSEIPEAAIGAYGVNRFLPGVGAVKQVGARGAAQALKELSKTALVQGVTSGAQDVAGQIGNTLGTKKGLNVDPTEALNSAVIGGATGAALKAPRTAGDIASSIKYRNFGGANADVIASAANDVSRLAGGADALKPGFFNSKGGAAFDAMHRAQAENKIELSNQLDAFKKGGGQLDAPAQAAVDRALAGEHLNERDHAAVTNAVKGSPNGDVLSFLVRKAGAFPIFQSTGSYSTKLGNFTGGVSGRLLNLVREHVGKTALAATFAGATEGPHLIAYSPEMLAAAGVGGLGLRALDRFTGKLNPAYSIVNRFADPNVQPPAVTQPPRPAGPGPTGPSVPPVPPMAAPGVGPWGQVTAAPTGNLVRDQIRETADLMAARRANAVLAQRAAAPLLKKLANSALVKNGIPIMAGIVGGHFAGELGGHIAHHATEGVVHGLIDKINSMQGQVTSSFGGQPAELPAPVPTQVPKDVLTQTRNLVRGLQASQKLKQRVQGENQAQKVIEASPLVKLAGGPDVVANPVAGQRMSQAVSAINALKRLNTQYTQGSKPSASTENINKPPTPEEIAENAGRSFGAKQPEVTDKHLKAEARTLFGDKESEQQAFINGFKAAAERIKKANGKVSEDDEPFPASTYAHLPVEEAATRITENAAKAGLLKYASGFKASTVRRIQGEREAVARIAAEVPDLPAKEIAARLEGVPNQTQAKAFREHLKKQYPKAVPAIDKHLSDEVIRDLWRKKG
jgi:hypothetical protein